MRNAIMAALLMTTTACMTPVVQAPFDKRGDDQHGFLIERHQDAVEVP